MSFLWEFRKYCLCFPELMQINFFQEPCRGIQLPYLLLFLILLLVGLSHTPVLFFSLVCIILVNFS